MHSRRIRLRTSNRHLSFTPIQLAVYHIALEALHFCIR